MHFSSDNSSGVHSINTMAPLVFLSLFVVVVVPTSFAHWNVAEVGTFYKFYHLLHFHLNWIHMFQIHLNMHLHTASYHKSQRYIAFSFPVARSFSCGTRCNVRERRKKRAKNTVKDRGKQNESMQRVSAKEQRERYLHISTTGIEQ